MPYCKYCGKKLEGGEKCSCPEASEKNNTLAGAADEIKEAASEKIENISDNAAGLKNESEKLSDNAKEIISDTADAAEDVLHNAQESISQLGDELRQMKADIRIPAPDEKTFRKGISLICFLIAVLILLIALLISALGGSCRKAVNDLVKGVNTCNSELVLRSVYPADYLKALKDDVSDEDDDWNYITDDLDEMIESVQELAEDEYFGRNPKLSIKILERDSVSSRTRRNIEEYFDDKDAEVSKVYKLRTQIKIQGKDASESAKVNLYAVKIRNSRWIVYADDKAKERISDGFGKPLKKMDSGIDDILSDYSETLDWFR